MDRETRLQADEAEDPILFYSPQHDYGWMSSFDHLPIVLPNPFTQAPQLYKTREHRFQAMKGTTMAAHMKVVRKNSPGEAKHAGSAGQMTLREGWGQSYGDLCWYVMLEGVMATVMQHEQVAEDLAATGARHIYEDSPTDDIWGWRYREDYRGQNLLGKCWMDARPLAIALSRSW